jgi:hypothetical protein
MDEHFFETIDDAKAHVPSTAHVLLTGGYTLAGDGGGATYRRAAVQPSHPGKFQSNDGAWWELISEPVNPLMFGAIGDGTTDDTGAVQKTIDSASHMVVPKRDFKIASVRLKDGIALTVHGRLLGTVYSNQQSFYEFPGVTSATVIGTVALTKGATTIPGNFSAYSPGEWIVVSLYTSGGSTIGNEIGVDYAKVTTANGLSMQIDRPLRFPYTSPNPNPKFKVQKLANIVAIGTPNHPFRLSRGESAIKDVPLDATPSGKVDFNTVFAAGDVVRIENKLEGNDTYYGRANISTDFGGETSYFEWNIVKSVSADELEFVNEFAFTYVNVYMVKANFTRDIVIIGNGYIKNLQMLGSRDISVSDITCQTIRTFNCIDFKHSNLQAIGNGSAANLVPTAYGFTFSRSGRIVNCGAEGAYANSDNAALKILSCQDMTIANAESADTFNSNSGQALSQFFVDFLYTPYASWSQNIKIVNLACGKPKGGVPVSIWLSGTRDVDASQVSASGAIRVMKSVNPKISHFRGYSLWVEDVYDGGAFDHFDGAFVNVLNSPFTSYDGFRLSGANGENSNWSFAVRSASDLISISNLLNLSEAAGDITFFLTGSSDVTIIGCKDRLRDAPAKSVAYGPGMGQVQIVGCSLKNPIDSAVITNGAADFGCDVRLRDGAWDRRRLIVGNYNLWVDSAGKLRIKNGPPVNDLDGAIVGLQS